MSNETQSREEILRNEIDDLRRIIGEKNLVIQRMLSLIEWEFTPVPETDLNEKSIHAASYYVEAKYKGAPVVERQLVVNSCAHGFFMGFRDAEKIFNALLQQTKENENVGTKPN